ncbi:hypothetical protein HDU89_004868 [Geranomyces variabilis]|nr:hypothetical protein HDU89_004868 [Geranomyces variabilis]
MTKLKDRKARELSRKHKRCLYCRKTIIRNYTACVKHADKVAKPYFVIRPVVPEFQPAISYLDQLQVNDHIIRACLAETEWLAFLLANGLRVTVACDFEFSTSGGLECCPMFEIGWALGDDSFSEPLWNQCDQTKVAKLLRHSFAKTPCDFVAFSASNCDEVLLRRLLDLSPTWHLYNLNDLVNRSLPYLISQVLPDTPYTAHNPDEDAKALLDLVELLRSWYSGSKAVQFLTRSPAP